jgi:hypothetical protein
MTDALRDAELLTDSILEALGGGVPELVALARFEEIRNRLSMQLFDVTERIASYAWDLPEIRTLLRRVSSAMSAEVDYLQSLPGPRTSGQHVMDTAVRC